jgi:hypothetical protein
MRVGYKAAAVIAVVSAVSAAAGGRPFVVTSTLDGKTVLPHRIHWVATPTLPPTHVTEVEFLIDGGAVRWIGRRPPYTYGGVGGYLVTSWLAPGLHRFTAKAIAIDRRVTADTVTARVTQAPAPPAALAGTWERTLAPTGRAGWAPGVYKLVFDRRWIELVHPGGTGQTDYIDWTPAKRSFRVRGPVTLRMQVSDVRGGWPCEPGGPGGVYAWSVAGRKLTLTPGGWPNATDLCALRGRIFTGLWTRVG